MSETNTTIIVKKVSKFLKAERSHLVIGDVRSQLARDLLDTLTKVIEDKADYGRKYWILVYSHMEPTIQGMAIKERVIILPKQPTKKFLGCCQFCIDPVLGDATVDYVLPLDIPAISTAGPERSVFKDREGVKSIQESARGLPIINRQN